MRSSVLAIALLCALSLPRCMSVTDGIEIDVAYQSAATPAAVQTDEGYRVWLDRALMAVGRAELIRCENFARQLWRFFAPARAKAHEFTTPTSLGVPVVLDLMESAGTALFAGTLRPPPGSYCGIRVRGMPADSDAVGLSEANTDMLQNSVVLEGRLEHRETGEEAPFATSIKEELDFEMLFDSPLVFDTARSVSVTVEIDHLSWFDGIDFALQDQEAVQRQITDNIRSSLRARRL